MPSLGKAVIFPRLMSGKKFYPETSNNPDFPKIEKEILAFWKREGTFKKSVEQSGFRIQDSGKNQLNAESRMPNPEWVFYDGPPFANGLPHYGHLLTSCVKDIFARYHTMKGERVERRFGWDCHGLPAEMEAEKELGVSGRAAIEKYGIAKFNEHCQTSVMKYTHIWEEYVNRAARWVDFENDYKTMDKDYMESVLWAFKQLYDKGLVYESHRVMPYSWAAQTPLSNFETRMDDSYREREDKSVYVKFELLDIPEGWPREKYYVIAWTTTPWTLPSNLALAVNSKSEYSVIKTEDGYWICSEPKLTELFEERFNTTAEQEDIKGTEYSSFKGGELLGLSYKPLFPYFKDHPNAFKILDGSDFIEEGSGTGVVHLAPGFGEDDQRVCEKAGIELVCPVDDAGRYTDEIFDLPKLKLKGLNVIEDNRKDADEPYNEKQLEKYGLANLRIITYLKETGALIKQEDFKHPYPHCWRTDKPLIYKALPSWYVEVTKFKDRMVQLNQNINWIPEHIKDGQFGKWLEGARDWSISRNRFWGTPIPIWRTESGKTKAFGSIKELEEFFFPQDSASSIQDSGEKAESRIPNPESSKIKDLHRPFIDTLTKVDPETGETWKRVTDVFDCWFESGSMPFAQAHYPFENKDWFETHFPADFIVEYVGQTRGWFYTLMVLATALFDKEPFKNCICHGIILDANGKKLSKRLRNYPDPNEMFEKYGADAMRWRMVSEPVMHGGNLLISKDGEDIRDVVRLVIKPIWNAYHFFTLYANTDEVKAKEITESENLMDKYILAKLKQAVQKIEKAMDSFMTPEACKAVIDFFEVLNNWYIRRSRERFWKEEKDADKQAAYDTLYTVLATMAKATAPLLPLTLEEIYSGLVVGESVHLAKFPDVSKIDDEKGLVTSMDFVRDACNAALSVRSAENKRIRQPLAKMTIYSKAMLEHIKSLKEIILDEVNVKNIELSNDIENIAALKLKINFPIVGKRHPEKMKQIAAAAGKGEWKENEEKGIIEICGEKLGLGDYGLDLVPKNGVKGTQQLTYHRALVVLDLNITPELKAEGLARDVVRMIQQARKDADLNVADRIDLAIEAGDEVKKAVSANENYIKEQTLTKSLSIGVANGKKHTAELDIEGEKVKIGFEKVA